MKLKWINQWTAGTGDWQLISIGISSSDYSLYSYDNTLFRLHFILMGLGFVVVLYAVDY